MSDPEAVGAKIREQLEREKVHEVRGLGGRGRWQRRATDPTAVVAERQPTESDTESSSSEDEMAPVLRSSSGRVETRALPWLFGMTGCPHTMRVRDRLTAWGVEFAEVDLMRYPGRVADMQSMGGGRMVPQVFAHYRLVCDAASLFKMQSREEFDVAVAENGRRLSVDGAERSVTGIRAPRRRASGPLSRSGRLRSSARDQRTLASSTSSRSFHVWHMLIEGSDKLEMGNEELDYLYRRMASNGPDGLLRHSVGHVLWRTRQVFRATELVMWLMRELQCSEEDAVRVGLLLLEHRYVIDEEEAADGVARSPRPDVRPLENSYETILKLRADVDPAVLNAFRLPPRSCTDGVSPHVVIAAMRAQLHVISEHYVNERRAFIDYARLQESQDWLQFENLAVLLQRVDLDLLLTDVDRVAFFLNVYFALLVHGLIHAEAADSPARRWQVAQGYAYVIGGMRFTLADVLHGVLRCNARPPGLALKRFSSGDPRFRLAPARLDPRVHLALHRQGDRPETVPVPYFDPLHLDDQLDYCAAAHIMSAVAVAEHHDVDLPTLPSPFYWFPTDFAASERLVVQWVVNFVDGEDRQASILQAARAARWSVPVSDGRDDTPLEGDDDSGGGGSESEEAEPEDKSVMNLEIADPASVLKLRPGWAMRMSIRPLSVEKVQPPVHLVRHFARDFAGSKYDVFFFGERASPVFVCVRKIDVKGSRRRFAVVVCTMLGQDYLVAAAPSVRDLWEPLQTLYRELLVGHRPVEVSGGERLETELAEFERSSVSQLTTYKCGVLYYGEGQTDEDEIFSNREHSKAFDDFLDVLGTRVKLQGFEGYAAGLDTEKGGTGEESVYSQLDYGGESVEIMFHVATLMPHNPRDKQQIDRKRHLGNDSVVIIFTDGSTPFDPRTITSQYCQIYILVVRRYDSFRCEHTYDVAITAREGVPPFVSDLPNPPTFFFAPNLRSFLHRQIIEGTQASLRAPQFRIKIGRSLRLTLQGIHDRHVNN